MTFPSLCDVDESMIGYDSLDHLVYFKPETVWRMEDSSE